MILSQTKHIVVIGGGFAGLHFIRGIAGSKPYTVTLVDKNNYNQFTPLVYQVATGFLEPSNISYPFRKFLRKRTNIRFHLGELVKVSPEEHLAYLSNATIQYDYLVLAFGSVSNFFGNDKLRQHSIAMKTLTDALGMRNTLLQSLEQACSIHDEGLRSKLLTVVIAGGGPTGVEIAGMLGEMRNTIIQRDYPELKDSMGGIYLVDGSKAVLSQMSLRSQKDAAERLEKLGVKILVNTFITSFDHEEVVLSNGVHIQTSNLVWAAGVTCLPVEGIPSVSYGKNGRLIVDRYNKVCDVDDIYAIGDNCLETSDAGFPNGHPQLAQPAIQQGKRLADNFVMMANGQPLKPFLYHDKGVMAVIGKNRAVVDLAKPRLHLNGVPALLVWLFIHINFLIAYDNKLKTLFNWIVAYLTGDQSLRVVIDSKHTDDR
ncbi:MAG: NAD(P)/FAD-dependent oxidoreductase [Williamsia sp.]|nr:NAD(P)/FAD-dependent oxidoreductase [Williamsia sp.]